MTKYVTPLTEEERATLRAAMAYGPSARVRQRAQAVYGSDQGFRIGSLAVLLDVDRDTVSAWLERWERDGLRGLYDAPRPGRPMIYTPEEQQQLREWVDAEPRQLKQAQARLAEASGKRASGATLKRILKKSTATATSAAGAASRTGAMTLNSGPNRTAWRACTAPKRAGG